LFDFIQLFLLADALKLFLVSFASQAWQSMVAAYL